jgi:hypothetical protein
VSDLSASQVEIDTVFAVNMFGSLSEYSGHLSGSTLQFSETDLDSNVAQVSAGIDGYGAAEAFVLRQDGTLWAFSSFFPNHHYQIGTGVTALSASQGQLETVVYDTTSWPGTISAVVEKNYGYEYLIESTSFNL